MCLSTLAYSKVSFLTVEKRSCLQNIYDKIRFNGCVAFFFFPQAKLVFLKWRRILKNKEEIHQKVNKIKQLYTFIFKEYILL